MVGNRILKGEKGTGNVEKGTEKWETSKTAKKQQRVNKSSYNYNVGLL